MQLARVIGEVVATVKDANLAGTTLLVLQPITASGDNAGRTLVALDSVGAGTGEHVFFVRGREPRFRSIPLSLRPTPRLSASSITGMWRGQLSTFPAAADLKSGWRLAAGNCRLETGN